MEIAIVTDSTSDISSQQAEEHNITVVPAILILGDEQHLDGEGISREDFYARMPFLPKPPTTAAPSSGMFTETYQKLFQSGIEHIVSIHVASRLSSIVTSAWIAAESFGKRVTVIDSGQLSMGLGFQALAAARATVQGSIKPVLDAIEYTRKHIHVTAMLDTLEQLKRSGRVSWLQSGLGTLLRVKIFLTVKESEVLRLGEARTRTKGIQRLTEMLAGLGPLQELAILHTNAPEDAQILADQFAPQSSQPVLMRNVTTVIGTHVGVNALGYAAVVAE